MREADSAFGDPTMFLEQAVVRPRHIEVQILADATGDTIHLFERDCSVQRRHQKVVEIAPAPNLDEETRQALYRDAVAFAEVDRLRQRRHRRVPPGHGGGAQGPARLHRDEPAHPGRAHRHRGGDRCRPGAIADAHRSGGDPRGARTAAGHARAPRRGAPVPDHDGGPRRWVPSGHRQDHGLPLTGRCGYPAGRRHGRGRRAGVAALRLDAREDDHARPGLPVRRAPRPARPRRVPSARGVHEHPVPAGGARRPGVHRGRPQHLLHRRAAPAPHREQVEGPRHEARHLARRDDREPPATAPARAW